MTEFTHEVSGQAHRAIVSFRNKCDKASGKLTEGSWQKKKMVSSG
jgi:hypothetical protein